MIRVCLVAPAHMTGGQAVEAGTLRAGFSRQPDVRIDVQPIDPRIPAALAAVPGLRTIIRLPLFIAGLIRRIRSADVVHVFTAAFWPFLLTTTPAIFLGRLFRRPVVLNYRDGRARAHLKYRFVRWTLRRASVLAFPSGFLRDVFREFGMDGVVIPNVVDTERFRFRRRRPLRPALLSTRLLETLYAVENTILAYEELRRSFPDATLTIVGDGHCRRDLEALTRARGLDGVHFVGRVPHQQMGDWYDQADILVNSSRDDNMPHCLIEAFAAGLAIVTTPSGGIPYVVQEGRNGLFVPQDDPRAMAAAVARLLTDQDLAEALIDAGQQDCEAFYSWGAACAQWCALYASFRPSKGLHPDAMEHGGRSPQGIA